MINRNTKWKNKKNKKGKEIKKNVKWLFKYKSEKINEEKVQKKNEENLKNENNHIYDDDMKT